ncbi:hypothetical protein DPX16_17892 [Anabarilius grahami]|uniref:Retrotransposon gag domain-containing protein n=1 Tax=Anabarilius grahami TaxID=495550 RepID=A0A3N0YHE0_ANAGA|nr:hypothetical protein DPX16_17892 [Anabarilius grahami]
MHFCRLSPSLVLKSIIVDLRVRFISPAYSTRNRRTDLFKQPDIHKPSMDFIHLSEAPTPPVPPTTMSAADRLIGLLQFGSSLERYVEEFVELAFLTNWSDARLNTLFLDGLDESTIRFEEPDDCFLKRYY